MLHTKTYILIVLILVLVFYLKKVYENFNTYDGGINKNIYILWFQGFDMAPNIVKKCLNSWEYHNEDWKIIELSEKNLGNYVNLEKEIINFKNKKIKYAALSDIIRISILKNYGGLWVDATTFCNMPLNEWLPNYIKNGFWCFTKTKKNVDISSWFIYSNKENYITTKWYNEVVNYWNKKDKMDNYFWFHKLFKNLLYKDLRFSLNWHSTKKLYANDCHYFFPYKKNLITNLDDNTKKHIDNKVTPLYKLTYKYLDEGNVSDKSSLSYLLNNNLELIHIGKCGGTTLAKIFKNFKKHIHLKKICYNLSSKYIICIRNPIERFVSAFNMSFNVINLNLDLLKQLYLSGNLTIENSIVPERIKKKFRKNLNYFFSEDYDNLIRFFKNANYLAESLSSRDEKLKSKAYNLMMHNEEHIFKGIGWYLDNGYFVEKYNKNILSVIRLENFDNDVLKLSKLLGVKNINIVHERHASKKKVVLSSLAINNIKQFYKNTDYKALESLRKYNFIDQQTLNSYYDYN